MPKENATPRDLTKLMLLGVLAGPSACTTCHKVTDPTSQEGWYTTEVGKEKGGPVSTKDASPGARVTIQNPKVIEIGSDGYRTATAKPKNWTDRCRGRTTAGPAMAATS